MPSLCLTHKQLKKAIRNSILRLSLAIKLVISPELIVFIDWLDKRSTYKTQQCTVISRTTTFPARWARGLRLTSTHFSVNQAHVGKSYLQCCLINFIDVLRRKKYTLLVVLIITEPYEMRQLNRTQANDHRAHSQ